MTTKDDSVDIVYWLTVPTYSILSGEKMGELGLAIRGDDLATFLRILKENELKASYITIKDK